MCLLPGGRKEFPFGPNEYPTIMIKKATTLFVTLFLAGTLRAGDIPNVAGVSGIALDGYDPVAFFSVKKPVHGDPGITATHEGATYLFSSEENRDLFQGDPEKYAPQFGGYCAYGVSVNALFPVDVSTWQIRDGKQNAQCRFPT